MADKTIKVKVNVDVDAEPSIAQLKALKKQLRDTAAGSEDFAKLQQQINDTEDAIKSARTGASNFSEVLGQLPGPIGDIGNKVSGTVNTLKQFGALKITDLKASFVELGKDLTDAAKGLGQLTGITKAYTVLNGFLAKSFVAVGVAEQTAAVGARALSAALIATGIGALVVLLATAASALYEMASGEKEAAAAADVLNRALERQNQLLELNAADTNRRNKVELARLKSQGASAQVIRETQFRQAKETYETAYKDEQEAVKIYNDNLGKADAEGLKKLTENLTKKQQATKDAYATAQEVGLNNKADELKEEEDKNKQLIGKGKALGDARIAERKRELEALKKGLEEARLNTLSAKDKELEEVRIKYDDLKAKAIKFGEDTKIIEQARAKENASIADKYIKEDRDKKQKEYEDTLALEEQQLNLRLAKGEITEREYQTKLFEVRKNAAVQNELLINDTLKKSQDTLNNQRIVDLANLQIALQNEQSTLQDSLDSKNAILLNDLQNGVINQEQFDAKKIEIELEYQTNLDTLNLDSLNKKAQIDVEYKTNLDTTNAEALSKNKDFIAAQIDLEKYKVEQKKILSEEERGILAVRIQSQIEALDAENARIEGDFQQDLERLAEKRELLKEQEINDLADTELTEFQKTEIRKKYADARKNVTDQEIATEKAAAQAKQEINMAYLGLFEQFGNVLGQLAGKNKALAIAGIIISQAASIGQIIANTGIANAKAVAASPVTFGMPWVAINTVSAGLSIASTIASAVKSIQQINQAAASAGVTGGGGGGSVGAAPNIPAPKVASAAAPEIQTGGGMNPTTQLGQTLTNSQKPLRAYVVSGEISSAQALDRRTNRAATFSGG